MIITTFFREVVVREKKELSKNLEHKKIDNHAKISQENWNVF
jgi:hypothetical protein